MNTNYKYNSLPLHWRQYLQVLFSESETMKYIILIIIYIYIYINYYIKYIIINMSDDDWLPKWWTQVIYNIIYTYMNHDFYIYIQEE